MSVLSRLLLALPLTVAAVELPVLQNVTGPYELRIQSDEPDAFADGGGIEFWNRETGKLVGKAGISYGGYGTAKNAAESMPVLWHGSGNYVAFTTRASWRSIPWRTTSRVGWNTPISSKTPSGRSERPASICSA